MFFRNSDKNLSEKEPTKTAGDSSNVTQLHSRLLKVTNNLCKKRSRFQLTIPKRSPNAEFSKKKTAVFAEIFRHLLQFFHHLYERPRPCTLLKDVLGMTGLPCLWVLLPFPATSVTSVFPSFHDLRGKIQHNNLPTPPPKMTL